MVAFGTFSAGDTGRDFRGNMWLPRGWGRRIIHPETAESKSRVSASVESLPVLFR